MTLPKQPLRWEDGSPLSWPSTKAVCVGRNYRDHAIELGNAVPEEPVLFIKPANAIYGVVDQLSWPPSLFPVHHEVELAFVVGQTLDRTTKDPLRCLCGVTLALDLTLRETQHALKTRGLPWEKAKAFDSSCPVAPLIPCDRPTEDYQFALRVNGEVRQRGDTRDWLFPLEVLLEAITHWFTLLPGDLILTGTPSGVGPLVSGDHWAMELNGRQLAAGRVT
jgi:2-keto-4-pentenoate hydratase/2-oxohepta-3-ene-1,7-dioic acid hydratase in catechol pathway